MDETDGHSNGDGNDDNEVGAPAGGGATHHSESAAGDVAASSLDFTSVADSIDFSKFTSSLDFTSVADSIDFSKFTSSLNMAEVFEAVPVATFSHMLEGVDPASVAVAASAATAVSTELAGVESVTKGDMDRLLRNPLASELPDRLIQLGSQGLEHADVSSMERIAESLLPEGGEKSEEGAGLPLAIGVCLVLGAFALVAAVHNSMVAADSPEAARFVSAFFSHLTFYVAVGALLLAWRQGRD